MSKFALPKRYDETLATDGCWFEVTDENDNFYGAFLCALIDPHSARVKKKAERIERLLKQNSLKFKGKEAAFRFVHLSVVDWRDVKDSKGKDVPFTHDDAIELLADEGAQFLLNTLYGRATDVTNYNVIPVEEIEKN